MKKKLNETQTKIIELCKIYNTCVISFDTFIAKDTVRQGLTARKFSANMSGLVKAGYFTSAKYAKYTTYTATELGIEVLDIAPVVEMVDMTEQELASECIIRVDQGEITLEEAKAIMDEFRSKKEAKEETPSEDIQEEVKEDEEDQPYTLEELTVSSEDMANEIGSIVELANEKEIDTPRSEENDLVLQTVETERGWKMNVQLVQPSTGEVLASLTHFAEGLTKEGAQRGIEILERSDHDINYYATHHGWTID